MAEAIKRQRHLPQSQTDEGGPKSLVQVSNCEWEDRLRRKKVLTKHLEGGREPLLTRQIQADCQVVFSCFSRLFQKFGP